MSELKDSKGYLTLLLNLALEASAQDADLPASSILPSRRQDMIVRTIAGSGREDFGELWGLAGSHHVIMRALPGLQHLLLASGVEGAEWVERALDNERKRIDHALSFLSPICDALHDVGDVVVIKSLDHWPDLGGDLDLYSNAEAADVVAIMKNRFNARLAGRSWGDRLANKWNFIVPGLPELVEVHVGRLGQTGEQVAIADFVVRHARAEQFGSHSFRVPAPEARLVITTLQRMYRHFYIRLCDIADTARLVNSGAVDFLRLNSLAKAAGLWNGLATYLVIVSGIVKSQGREELPLPAWAKAAAQFGDKHVRFRRGFLRLPVFPQAASLYVAEWQRLLRNGELRNTLRLSLLPGLAAAAALEWKLTGSDKGVW